MDTRGGYFVQGDLVRGLRAYMEEPDTAPNFGDHLEAVDNLAKARNTNRLAVLEKLAMYIRVMLNHLRQLKRQVAKGRVLKGDAQGLMVVLDMMETSATPTKSKPEKAAICPLPAFQDGAAASAEVCPDSDEEGNGDGGPQLVCTYWDGELFEAVQLYSDSSIVGATWYEEGDIGCVLACFEEGATLQLEIPNCCLVDGKIDKEALLPPEMPKKREKKGKGKGEETLYTF